MNRTELIKGGKITGTVTVRGHDGGESVKYNPYEVLLVSPGQETEKRGMLVFSLFAFCWELAGRIMVLPGRCLMVI